MEKGSVRRKQKLITNFPLPLQNKVWVAVLIEDIPTKQNPSEVTSPEFEKTVKSVTAPSR